MSFVEPFRDFLESSYRFRLVGHQLYLNAVILSVLLAACQSQKAHRNSERSRSPSGYLPF